MQYVFLIRSSAGGKKYITRRSRVTYFLPPAIQCIKIQKHVLHGQETVSIFIANLHVIFNDILNIYFMKLKLMKILVSHLTKLEKLTNKLFRILQNKPTGNCDTYLYHYCIITKPCYTYTSTYTTHHPSLTFLHDILLTLIRSYSTRDKSDLHHVSAIPTTFGKTIST